MEKTSSITPIKRALISVSDKTDIIPFAKALSALGIEIISTGGTAKTLQDAGLDIIPVAEVTGSKEMMDGRVKTLNPKIHGAILAQRDNEHHRNDMEEAGITGIDLVVVNLYPFANALKNPDATRTDLIENIDIGGPAMIRAAAKNHDFVTILTQADDYQTVLDSLNAKGGTSLSLRRKLAARAFAHTAHYDSMITSWMRDDDSNNERLPDELCLGGRRVATMRYGENPHQEAALYAFTNQHNTYGVLSAEQSQGKPLSFNNINDTDAAFELVAEFTKPTIAIIKHANPCGVASHDHVAEAYKKARAADPISAFGGIIAVNAPLTAALAEEIITLFTEVVIAPHADDKAKAIMATKPNIRLLLTGGMPSPAQEASTFRSVAGGFLTQSRDAISPAMTEWQCVTKRKPSSSEIDDMIFAMSVAKHVKSNAIVFARDLTTVAIGAGQMSRLDACRIAALKMNDMPSQERPQNFVVASDAFFPFADGLLMAAEAGAKAVIQPGGSVNDDQVIAAANDADIAMIFTGKRHFKH